MTTHEKKQVVANMLFEMNYERNRFFEKIDNKKYNEIINDPTAVVVSDGVSSFILKEDVSSDISLFEVMLLTETFNTSKKVRSVSRWVKFLGWVVIISSIVVLSISLIIEVLVDPLHW